MSDHRAHPGARGRGKVTLDVEFAERLADVAVAVPTPAVAEFLLAFLERTQFASPRAGEFARHAVQQLPADRLAAIEPVMRSLATAPAAQQLAFAEGLASVSRLAGRTRPVTYKVNLYCDLKPDYLGSEKDSVFVRAEAVHKDDDLSVGRATFQIGPCRTIHRYALLHQPAFAAHRLLELSVQNGGRYHVKQHGDGNENRSEGKKIVHKIR